LIFLNVAWRLDMLPGPNPVFVKQMLARNRRLFERARELGGTRYAIGSIEFDHNDWVRQYADFWAELVQRKRQYRRLYAIARYRGLETGPTSNESPVLCSLIWKRRKS
jgi:hypothetical protein